MSGKCSYCNSTKFIGFDPMLSGTYNTTLYSAPNTNDEVCSKNPQVEVSCLLFTCRHCLL